MVLISLGTLLKALAPSIFIELNPKLFFASGTYICNSMAHLVSLLWTALLGTK